MKKFLQTLKSGNEPVGDPKHKGKLEWQTQGGERGLDNFCAEFHGNGATSTKHLGFTDVAGMGMEMEMSMEKLENNKFQGFKTPGNAANPCGWKHLTNPGIIKGKSFPTPLHVVVVLLLSLSHLLFSSCFSWKNPVQFLSWKHKLFPAPFFWETSGASKDMEVLLVPLTRWDLPRGNLWISHQFQRNLVHGILIRFFAGFFQLGIAGKLQPRLAAIRSANMEFLFI